MNSSPFSLSFYKRHLIGHMLTQPSADCVQRHPFFMVLSVVKYNGGKGTMEDGKQHSVFSGFLSLPLRGEFLTKEWQQAELVSVCKQAQSCCFKTRTTVHLPEVSLILNSCITFHYLCLHGNKMTVTGAVFSCYKMAMAQFTARGIKVLIFCHWWADSSHRCETS